MSLKCAHCGQFGHLLDACSYEPVSRKGTKAGGIFGLEDIRARCYVNYVTDCWEWRGAASRGRGSCPVPVAWSATHGRVMSVLRLAYGWHRNNPPKGKTLVWRTCESKLCVNPKHLKAGTRAEMGAWLEREGRMKGNPMRAAVNRRIRLQRGTTLTMELAQWARESRQTGVEAAHGLLCSPQQVSRARRLECWRPLAPSASVFSLGLAGNVAVLRRTA